MKKISLLFIVMALSGCAVDSYYEDPIVTGGFYSNVPADTSITIIERQPVPVYVYPNNRYYYNGGSYRRYPDNRDYNHHGNWGGRPDRPHGSNRPPVITPNTGPTKSTMPAPTFPKPVMPR